MTRSRREVFVGLLETVAKLSPEDVSPSDELRRSLAFLDAPVSPETVLRAGYGIGGVTALLALAVTGLAGLGILGILVALALSLAAVHLCHETPKVLALARRTRALGRTPDLLAQVVLRMRLAPAPERAAAFAAKSGDGPLAESLEEHVRRGRVTGTNALTTFGNEWARWYPTLDRALGLVSAAASMESQDRDRTLDRAMSVVLDGTRSTFQSFVAWVGRPVTALYAFGVLLPTALVALVPAGAGAGIGVTTMSVVVVYDVVLPAVIVTAGVWLVARRPVAFPPPDVDRTHPEIPDRKWIVAGLSLLTAAATGLVATRVVSPWTGPIAAAGIGIGTGLWLRYRAVVAVYDRIAAVESALPDALSLVGRRVANGVAVESAVRTAAGELDGAMGEVFADAETRQRQLNVGVTAAFLGEYGALSSLPSPRVRGSMAVLGLAAEEGAPAGSLLLTLADHVEDLQRVEMEARRAIEEVSGTLRSTGALFGPLVAGATVALADTIAADSLLSGTQSLPYFGMAVGGYVLAFAVVLPALATGLSRGFDGPLVGYRVGRALLLATPVYLGSYLVVGTIA